MIAVRFWGGLGNQFFQYSFGRALSIETGEELFFYVLENDVDPDSLPILNFNVTINFLRKEDLRKYYRFYGCDLLVRAERKITSIFPVVHRHIHIEKTTSYTMPEPPFPVCFDGYWQSYRYFSGISGILKNEFTLRKGICPPAQLAEEIAGCESVSVHVRRGDYLSRQNKSVFRQCDDDYYREAIRIISEKADNPVFFIFSDDPGWVRENMGYLPHQTRFIADSGANPSWIDISLMRKCRHNIIANSTFSWWGAYLGSSGEKIIIAPGKWYIGKADFLTGDLIPSEWIVI